jgi:O-antigen/teichoic acid export membrane protein
MPFASMISALAPDWGRKVLGRVSASPFGLRLAHGALWSLMGALVSRLLGLAAFIIVARLLGKAGYGQFGIIQSTVGMFGVFAGFGLGQTATKYVAELRNKDPERAGRIMAMAGIVATVTGTLMAAVLFVFAPWLANKTLAAPELAPLLRIGSLILIFEAMNGAQMGALAGFEAFKTAAIINIWVGLATFPMMALGVYWGGLTGGIWALAANRALNWLLYHFGLRREAKRVGVPFVLHGSRAEFRILLHYSLPSMLSGLMVTPTIWICNAMLVNQPEGYSQMGIFQATMVFQQILLFMGNTLSAPLLPLLANHLDHRDDRLERINMLSTWALGAFVAVFFLGIPEIATILFGKGFAGPHFTHTFLLIVFGSSIVIYKQGLARILSAHGLMWWGTLSNLIWGVTLIGFTWLLVSRGAFGYAIAWACAYGINTFLFLPLYIYKRLVPKGTIISLDAYLVWMLLLTVLAMSLVEMKLEWRLAFMPIALASMGWLFWRLMTKK